MGDRILYQVVCPIKQEFSPVIYAHWSGNNAGSVCKRLWQRMQTRPGDVEYTAARLIQELIDGDSGNTGFGIWNADRVLTKEDSHGDAGIILVIAGPTGLTFECFGGYLTVKNGWPCHKHEKAA
jgi:hypothetical protein